jgi:hypothetical protein
VNGLSGFSDVVGAERNFMKLPPINEGRTSFLRNTNYERCIQNLSLTDGRTEIESV